MRGETVAEGIKRRTAERAAAQRKAMATWVQLAIWSGVIGFVVMVGAITASVATGWRPQ